MGSSGVRLGDFVSLVRGTTYKSSRLGEPGPVLLGLASIQRDGGFRDDNLKTYGGESPQRLILKPGELYVSLKDVTQSGDLLGAVARVPTHVASGRLTQDTVKLDFDGDAEWRNYVHWALRAPEYRAYCRARAIGTTNLSLSRGDFLAFELPPLTVGRSTLVSIFEALDDKIELNRKMSRTLDDTARAIFKSWFVEPAQDSWASGGSTLPAGWSQTHLGDHAEATRGLSYSSRNLVAKGEGLPLHNLNTVLEGGGYKYAGIKWFDGVYKERNTVIPGDLVVTNVEQGFEALLIGFGALVPQCAGPISLFSADLFRVRTVNDSPFTSVYLYQLLREPRFHRIIAGYSNGTTVNHLSHDAFSMPCVVVPPTALVQEYASVATPMLHRMEQLHEESLALASLRDTLLPRLLSGELRILDAEKIVEEVV